eukprot:425967-Rhodomonas_salina.1
MDLVPDTDDVHIHESVINEFTARELRDTLEACQLHMRRLLDRDGHSACKSVLFKLFTRFGVLASRACAEEVMDDKAYITQMPSEAPEDVFYIFTCKALRTLLDVFLVLFRVTEIAERAVPLD